MFLIFLQILGVSVLVVYIAHWRKQQWRRAKRSWEEIAARLSSHSWGMEEISERYLYKSGIRATTDDIWARIAGCSGLWSMYKNAPVLIELADYAARHGDGVDRETLDQLRRDAFQIRAYVLLAMVQHAATASSAGASLNAHRAAVAYSEMLARLTVYIQEHSTMLFPRYLDAVA
jgi:hypothetical protein